MVLHSVEDNQNSSRSSKAALKIRLGSTPQLPSDKTVDEVVIMIEKEQDEWVVEEVLDDDVVGMLSIQFDNMFGI